jgi:hypothetical protein
MNGKLIRVVVLHRQAALANLYGGIELNYAAAPFDKGSTRQRKISRLENVERFFPDKKRR